MADELRYIDFVDRGTMTASLGSLTSNRAIVSVAMTRRTGGYVANLPSGLIEDLYAIRFQSQDGKVDVYEEIDTRATAEIGFTTADRTRLNATLLASQYTAPSTAINSLIVNGSFTAAALANAPTGGGSSTSAIVNALAPQLNRIETAADWAALPLVADTIAINSSAIATYTLNGVTKLRQQLLGADDNPNSDAVKKQVRLP